MYKEPWVSIVIPCYNYGEFIEEAIDSCLASSFQDFEIIVVNDGSTDAGTTNILSNLRKPRTRVIHQANQGPAAARNRAIREARGKYIFPLDSDDRIHPTLLEKGIWVLETRPEVGFVTTWLQTFGEYREVSELPPCNFYELLFNNMVVGNSLFRKMAWEQVGGYSESKEVQGYEDWDFWIKLFDHGWKPHQIKEPLFYYRKHGESLLSQTNKRHHQTVQAIRNNHAHLFEEKQLELLKCKYADGDPDLPLELAWPHGPDAYTLKPRDAAKRKVLIVTSWLEFGGAEKITGELVQALPDQQFEVTVVTTLDSPAPRFEYSLELIRDIFYLPNYFSKPEHIDALLLHIIQTRDIEVILINNSLVGYNMLPTAKELFPHIKALAMLHSYVPELPWDFVRKSVETDSCIDQYLVSKQSLKATMETIFSVNPEKIQVFVSGVDTALFAPGSAEKIAKIKRQLQLEENMQIVSFISRLDYDKEPLKLISIVKHLMRYDPERRVCCMIVGDGVRKKELADEIRRQNLDHNVKFLGYRNDIPDMLKISDVLISTSPSEGIPITGLEAMATGVPVIAFDVPGWQELIQNGKDGILIPRSSVEEEQFALAIQQLLADPLRKTKLGIAGKQKVMRKHRLDQFRACIREAFERPPSSSAFAQVQRSPAQRSIVTIAIVAYNQAHTIKQAIDNVITQTIPNWKLFIVNDASTDHTEAIIRPYLRDSRVRLISNEERQGYGKCLDTMIAKTKTPYFLLHDAEEWLEADAVQYMLGKALMLPDHVAGFCGNVRIWIDKADHKEIIKGDRFSDPWELLLADPCIWPCFFRTSVLKRLQGRKADLETDNQYLAQLRLLIHLLESYDLHWIDNLVSNHRVRYDRTASKLRELSMANRASLKLALRDISPYGLHQ